MKTAVLFRWTTHESVGKEYQINRWRNPPFVVIYHCVSLKSPQLLWVYLYPLKRVAETIIIDLLLCVAFRLAIWFLVKYLYASKKLYWYKQLSRNQKWFQRCFYISWNALPPHLKVKEWWMNADQTLSEHTQYFSTIEANEVQPQNLAVTVPEILYFPHMNGKQTGYKRCIFWNI